MGLLFLLLLVGAWFLPWTDALTLTGVASRTGPPESGAVAAFALVALWCLGLVALLARTPREIRVGGALTDAALALLATGLLFVDHPWIPGGDLRATYVPIFAPLGLLALLHAAVLVTGREGARDVETIRWVTALFAAGALAVDRAWLPAGLALWLAVSPLLLGRSERPPQPVRAVHALLLVAALVAFFAPELHRALVQGEESSLVYAGRYGWQLASAALVLVALHGLWRPSGAARS